MQLYQQNNDIHRIFHSIPRSFPPWTNAVLHKKTHPKNRTKKPHKTPPKPNHKPNWFIINPSNHDDQNAEAVKYTIYSVYLDMSQIVEKLVKRFCLTELPALQWWMPWEVCIHLGDCLYRVWQVGTHPSGVCMSISRWASSPACWLAD